jgi:FlaA1/EpsC-like NDP-sugar epimerase
MGDNRFSVLDKPLARFEADIAHDQNLVALVQGVRRAFATPHNTELRCSEYLCPVVASLVDKWNKDGARVVIYGASMHTSQLFEWTNLSDASIVAIADKDTTLHGSYFHGNPVIPATDITNVGAEIILVSSQRYQEEICDELVKLSSTFKIETLYPRVSRT